MMDVNYIIEKDLQSIGITPVFFYPEEKTQLPAVSYYNLTEKSNFSMDNNEAVTYYAVQIDVWDKNPAKAGEIAEKIKSGLTALGWTREFSGDLPPDESGIYHKTIRFSKSFLV